MDTKDKNVFISYGHNNFDEVVERFKNDIKSNGYNVFFDKDYLHLGDWEEIIDNHIRDSKYFIFMISARSVAKDGYCLNELCRAGEVNSIIIPVVLDESMAPLSINKYQRLSLLSCIRPDKSIDDNEYNKQLNTLLKILSGDLECGYTNKDVMLKRCLAPVSSRDELFRHYSVFKGRRQAFKEFEEFMNSDNNVLWLPAAPGTGKTAFSSMLCWNYRDSVAAIHFCKFNNSDRTNPKKIFASLAYELSNSLPLYKQKLSELNELDKLYEKNAERIFEYLLIEPLHDITPDKSYALVIDALDEASFRGDNEVCAIIQRAKLKNIIPSWLKFVLTSRNEVEVSNYLNYISVKSTQFEKTTNDDIKEYYLEQFPQINDEQLEILLNKSEGSFLYATEITKQIKVKVLSLENINLFPPGIYGFYNDCLNRIFSPEANKGVSFDDVKPVLEFLCIFTEVVTPDFLEEILKMDDYEINKLLAAISGLFKISDDGIEPIHKSLIDWLTDTKNLGNKYFISKKSGYKRLYDYLKVFYDKGKYTNNNLVKYYGKTLIELKKNDELFELLDNYRFLSARNRRLHFDAGLREYLLEISKCEEKEDVFSTDTFKKIFEENRRLLYNSGMFFNLRDLGFTEALADGYIGDFELEGEVGIAFYYYIVEEFEKAIKQCKYLLKKQDIIDIPVYAAELYNVKGLSERKLVEFDDALESFKNAIEYASKALDLDENKNSDPYFELSMSYLITGKILTNMLKFDEADKSLDESVRILKQRIDDLDDGDEKTAKLLFLAEEYRVYAYTCIWEGNFEKAEELLDNCDEIYKENKSSTDRYFLRYQYTSCLLNIMNNEHEGADIKLLSLLKNAKGKYDIGTINSYLGLIGVINRNNEAIKYIDESKKIFKKIKAYLELNEAQMIDEANNIINSISTKVEYEFRNDYSKNWIDYARDIILRIVE